MTLEQMQQRINHFRNKGYSNPIWIDYAQEAYDEGNVAVCKEYLNKLSWEFCN